MNTGLNPLEGLRKDVYSILFLLENIYQNSHKSAGKPLGDTTPSALNL